MYIPRSVRGGVEAWRRSLIVTLAAGTRGDGVCQLDVSQSELHNERGGPETVNIELRPRKVRQPFVHCIEVLSF